jgi:hypothetical protein
MPTTITLIDPREFETLHGGKGYHIGDKAILKDFPEGHDRFLYPDGATYSATTTYLWWAPPTDAIMLLRFRKAYAAELLRMARLNFHRTAELAFANPSEGSKQQLLAAKSDVMAKRHVWQVLDDEFQKLVSETPAFQKRLERDRQQAAYDSQRIKLQEEIRAIVTADNL